MPISDLKKSLTALAASGVITMTAPAMAFDSASVIKPDSNPWAVFKDGFNAYSKGEKDKAVEAYRFAAEKGHAGARWKLAHMYADGDGVPEDDYEAFQIFEKIVRQGAEPGTPDSTFVSSALVSLAAYLERGIPGTPVRRDQASARELYSQAASAFGNPDAQFHLGRMLFYGEGGSPNIRQAGRWFKLAAHKGNAGAQAMLGNILFQSGKMVRGLAMITVALESAKPADRSWIRDLQEQAFALAPEAERRTAIAVAENMRNGKK